MQLLLLVLACATPQGSLAQRDAGPPVPFGRGAQQRGEEPALEDYRDLWKRGEYSAALRELNAMLGTMLRGVPPRYLCDRAELYALLGQPDLAIRDMELLCRQISAPVYTLRLAELYRSVGREELFRATLEEAANQAENRWFYGAYEDNVVAMARIQELKGENPRTILRTLLDPLIASRPSFAGGYVAAGNLALSKGDYALAGEYFEKALAVENGQQEALAGRARCQLESGDPRFETSLQALVDINPAHPAARIMQAEILLRDGQAEAALVPIEAGLAVNPAQLRLLGLKSAALFLLDRKDEMEGVQELGLKLNARSPEIFRTTGLIASRRSRHAEAAEFQRAALAVDPADHEAEALLGFELLSLGRQEEGKARLESAFKHDPFDARVFNTLKVLDKMKKFETLERGDFRLMLPAAEAPVLGDDAFDLLEAGKKTLGEKYGLDLKAPVTVQFFDRHEDFLVRTLGFPGAAPLLGVCFGALVTLDSPSANPPGRANWRAVLWHEFAHVITLQKTGNRIPRWLSEGISIYEEGVRDPAWAERADVQYKAIVAREGLPKVGRLEQYFSRPRGLTELIYGYFVAGEFVDYYVEAHGFKALRGSLERIGRGEPAEAALARAADLSADELDAAFAEHLRHRFRKFENLPEIAAEGGGAVAAADEGTSVTLGARGWSEARSPFTDAMAGGLKALEQERWKQAEVQLKRAYELFPDYQGADAPLRMLVALYERQGRRAELRKALEEQLRLSDSDLTSFHRYLKLLEEEKDWGAVAETAERAFGANPFDTGFRLARARAAVELGQTDAALGQFALLALLDAPRAADYRLRRVETLIAARRWDQARDEVFVLLEEMPYFWEAQAALLKIVERDRASAAGVPGGAADATLAIAGP